MFNSLYRCHCKRLSLIKKEPAALFSHAWLCCQWLFVPGFLMLTIWLPQAQALQTHATDEQLKVKAAFVLNLTRFVKWPEESGRKKARDVMICFYQYNFLEQAIDTIRNKKIQNKTIHFKLIQSLKITERCDVVLVPATAIEDFLHYNEYSDLQNRITITDLSSELSHVSSLENKIIFRLKREQARLRFEVNKKAAEYLGITIGSELLKLGIMVNDTENDKKLDEQGKDTQ